MTHTVPLQERLESMIPEASLANAYVNRKIHGIEDFKVFDWARRTKTNLLIKGPTQSAKTMGLRAYAASRQLPCVTVDVGASLDPALTLGTHTRDANGQLSWYDGQLTCVIRNGEAVAIIDECNMAHPKVMGAYHPLGDARRAIYLADTGERVAAGPGLLLAATMNPEYIGTTPLGQAFSARFQHVPWDYDPAVEKKLLAPSVITFAKKLRKSEYINTPVSTHMLMKFQETVADMGYKFAIKLLSGSFSAEEAAGLDYALEAGLADDIQEELVG